MTDPARSKPPPTIDDMAAGLRAFGDAMKIAAEAIARQQRDLIALSRRVEALERRGRLRAVPTKES